MSRYSDPEIQTHTLFVSRYSEPEIQTHTLYVSRFCGPQIQLPQILLFFTLSLNALNYIYILYHGEQFFFPI